MSVPSVQPMNHGLESVAMPFSQEQLILATILLRHKAMNEPVHGKVPCFLELTIVDILEYAQNLLRCASSHNEAHTVKPESINLGGFWKKQCIRALDENARLTHEVLSLKQKLAATGAATKSKGNIPTDLETEADDARSETTLNGFGNNSSDDNDDESHLLYLQVPAPVGHRSSSNTLQFIRTCRECSLS